MLKANNIVLNESNTSLKDEIDKLKTNNIVLNDTLNNNNFLLNIKIEILNQIILIKDLEKDINRKIDQESMNMMKSEIKGKVYKLFNIFRYLNNIRLILNSRKYINKLIKIKVETNKNLVKTKQYLFNDLRGFKYKNDEKKCKMYISQLTVQMGNNKLNQDQYNLTLDFLYFLKSSLNDTVHFVKAINSELNTNKKEYKKEKKKEKNDDKKKEYK